MRQLKCCVIDDEPLAQELIKSYIVKTPFLKFVDAFPSASLAIKTVISNDIDIVFLDIQMSELNGIEFSKLIPPHTKIIFVTAFEQYALEAFKSNAIDYLLKPVSYTEFLTSANKALNWFALADKAYSAQSNEQYIMVKSESKILQIPVSTITYIEGFKDYVKIFTEDSSPIISMISLKVLENTLPQNTFMRVHRSYIVNTNKIKVIDRSRIVFGNQYIPVSDSYKGSFSHYVNMHLINLQKEENQ